MKTIFEDDDVNLVLDHVAKIATDLWEQWEATNA